MINGEHKFNAKKDKSLDKSLNEFANIMLNAAGQQYNLKQHQYTFSCLYQLYVREDSRNHIENCRKLVVKTVSSSYTKEQRQIIADRLKDMISFIAEETLAYVKPQRRLDTTLFKKMVYKIIIDETLFKRYSYNADKIVSAYYRMNKPALESNPKTEVTYQTRINKTKKVF